MWVLDWRNTKYDLANSNPRDSQTLPVAFRLGLMNATREKPIPKSRIGTIDSYRALAILSVICFHYLYLWGPPRQAHLYYPYTTPLLIKSAVQYGYIGVELFFMVSGFVILMTLERCTSVMDFFTRRIARLWPAMLFWSTVTAIVLNVWGPTEWHVGGLGWLLSIMFIEPAPVGQILHNSAIHWVDGAYRTLWVEVRFYTLAGVAFAVTGRQFLKAWLLLSIMVFLIGWFTQGTIRSIFEVLFFIDAFPYFTFGMFAYEIFSNRDKGSWRLAGLIASAMIILAQSLHWTYYFDNLMGFLIANVMIIGLFAIFVFAPQLVMLIAWRPIRQIGEASYSIYLSHQMLGLVFMGMLAKIMPAVAALAATLCLIIFCSFIFFYRVEEPSKRYLHDKFRPLVKWSEQRVPALNFKSWPSQPS